MWRWCTAGCYKKTVGLDILSVKKEAKLSAREVPGVEEGNGEEDLWCKSLFIVCQRHLGLSDNDKVRIEVFFGCENKVVLLVVQSLKRGPVKSRVTAFPEVLKVANSTCTITCNKMA